MRKVIICMLQKQMEWGDYTVRIGRVSSRTQFARDGRGTQYGKRIAIKMSIDRLIYNNAPLLATAGTDARLTEHTYPARAPGTTSAPVVPELTKRLPTKQVWIEVIGRRLPLLAILPRFVGRFEMGCRRSSGCGAAGRMQSSGGRADGCHADVVGLNLAFGSV